jgi:polyribonucleotide nucleotidyltransferase
VNPDTLAMVGAGAALALSDIPFPETLAAVRVGLVDGKFIANPTYDQVRASKLSITVAGTDAGIVMVEAGANGVSEAEVLEAIDFGHACCKKIVAGIRELVSKAGKPKMEFTPPALNQELYDQLSTEHRATLADALDTQKHSKEESHASVHALKKQVMEAAGEELKAEAGKVFEALKERIFREQILDLHRRPDGRKFDEIRPITIEVGVLPRVHGSALFTRGETQALVTVTLGTKDDEQRLELLEGGETSKRFMVHYNFPPFSVGEVGFMRGAGRREIGHGALAERALTAVVPADTAFPYTMRVVSDILESNGSSSMATVCGATLSLMDAGVPLPSPVAGVAMGLVIEGDRYAVLTDIAGAEDHYGDMDFKVAGSKAGITALQMDIKISGITAQIMAEALGQAKAARLHVLGKMLETLAEPRKQISEFAPRIYTLQINRAKIGELIGPGGKVIRGIIEQTGVKIDVEDDGKVNVAATDETAASKALKMIKDLLAEAELGKTYLGKVVRLADFGAFVEIFPGTDGLLHISEVAEHRIRDIRDELKEGDQLLVKVIAIEGNKIRLSRKAVLREQKANAGAKPDQIAQNEPQEKK